MNPVKFAANINFQHHTDIADEVTVVREGINALVEAEAMGYDAVYFTEHMFSPYSLTSSPTALASIIAGRTKTIKIGVAAVVVPLGHPLRIAGDWAMVDVISEGRVELGVGRGFIWYDYDSMGIDMQEGQDRFSEAIQIIRNAWTDNRVTFHGKFFDIVSTEVRPKPVQTPFIPVFYAASSPESVIRAAKLGIGAMTGQTLVPKDLNKYKKLWLETMYEEGYPENEINHIVEHTPNTSRIIWIADTDKQAQEEARANFGRFEKAYAQYCYPGDGYPNRRAPKSIPQMKQRSQPGGRNVDLAWEELIKCYGVIAGSPKTVRIKLEELLDQAPMNYMSLYMNYGGPHPDAIKRNMRLFATKVMPYFK
jgi:alkanesulfonate monooxygenase SsuD/methylene tetrahydromethanopterin reductase-like flavin-dependent oxidoreductase (luciferase family)